MSKSRNLYVDFHVIQTVPPSCINRDDTGSPKSAVYGGVRRARVSSQSWKRAVRKDFQENLDESALGIRTKKLVELIANQIVEIDAEKSVEDAQGLAEKVLTICGLKIKDKESGALFFMSRKQAHNLAELILTNPEAEKKVAQSVLNMGHGIDVALFGRMVADDPSLNADASAQVAHAISTHRVENEYDFFVAEDDLSPADNAGAGMMGVVEFNSSTLYRYATVAVHGLLKELDGNTEVTVKAITEFSRSFIASMPTGMQNPFAHRTLPDFVVVTVREDQPINMVGAFEKPVQNKGDGYVKGSISQLTEYTKKVYSSFASEPLKTWVIGENSQINGERIKIDQLGVFLKEQVEWLCESAGAE